MQTAREIPSAIKPLIEKIDPAMLYPARKASELIGLDHRSLELRRRKRQRPEFVTIGSRAVRYPGQALIDLLLEGAKRAA